MPPPPPAPSPPPATLATDSPFAKLTLPYGVGPRLDDREAWTALPLDRDQILRDAEAQLPVPPPPWGEAEYLAYFTSGSRQPHGDPFGKRLNRVGLFTIAAGLTADPRFITATSREITAILDEPTWVIPAHDTKTQDNFYGRVTDVDLGVVMRAWTLATAGWVLGDHLEPALRERLRPELHRRAVVPYLLRLAGDNSLCKWVYWQGNWNAVCHSGIIGAALYASPDPTEVARVVQGMQLTIEKSFAGHAADGYCSEGIMYHNYGFGHYADLAETLHRATGGAVDLFATERIRAIAAFPTRFEIFDQRFPSFADTPYGSRASRGLQTLLAYRLNDATLLPPALRAEGKPFGFGIGSLIYDTLLVVTTPPPPPIVATEWAPRHEFTEGGVLIVRPLTPGDTTLGAAFKGGHNAELHNHNDVGTYAIAVGDSFPVTDVGSEIYLKDSFGEGRYKRAVNNSYGHNVPVIDGLLQSEGRAATAFVLRRDFSPASDLWELDLTSCYAAKNLVSLRREFRYLRDPADPRVEITDRYAFREPGTYANAFMTLGSWERRNDHTLAFTHGKNTLSVEVESETAFTVSEDPLPGQNLNYKLKAIRIGIEFPAAVIRGEVRYTFRPSAQAVSPPPAPAPEVTAPAKAPTGTSS